MALLLETKGTAGPELNEAIDTVHAFFEQIARALEKDEILVADWMPQLNRFL